MLVGATVVVLAAGVALADAALLDAIRNASSLKEAEVAARKMEARLPEGGDRIAFLGPIVQTLERAGFRAPAESLLVRSKGRVGVTHESQLRLQLAALQFRAGRLEAARRSVVEGLALADDVPHEGQRKGLVSDLHWRSGEIEETAGRFAEARAAYEQTEWASFCGVGAFEFLRQREFAIARCRFEEGATDAALDKLLELVGDGETALDFADGEIAVRFAEYSARAGRDDATERLAKRVAPARRDEIRRLARIGTAVNALDVAAILAAASEGAGTTLPEAGAHLRTTVPVAALRELRGLGPAVQDAVSRAIVAGDRVATLMAMHRTLPGAEAGVRARREQEPDDDWRRVMSDWLRARAESD